MRGILIVNPGEDFLQLLLCFLFSMHQPWNIAFVAIKVRPRVAERPHHRSLRALFPHRALRGGGWGIARSYTLPEERFAVVVFIHLSVKPVQPAPGQG